MDAASVSAVVDQGQAGQLSHGGTKADFGRFGLAPLPDPLPAKLSKAHPAITVLGGLLTA
jgi:hypothetical protein